MTNVKAIEGRLDVRALDLVTGHTSRGVGRVRWSPARSGLRDPISWDVHEEGMWRSGPCRGTPFRGAYRWERTATGLVVSHLRRGKESPVRLARLVRVEPACTPEDGPLAGHAPHRCGADWYDLRVRAKARGLALVWSIEGPRKRVRLRVWYDALPRRLGLALAPGLLKVE